MIYNHSLISKEYIQNELDTYGVPGMGLAVSVDGSIAIEAGFGLSDIERNIPMTEKHHWCIASCSKAYTATLAVMMQERGQLSLDIPIQQYIPEFSMYDKTAASQCTMRDMLLHRTGLANHDALWMDQTDRADLFRRLPHLKPAVPFRSEMLYNNTMYTIAGHIEERISGISWEGMVRQWILEPLGMTSSGTTLRDLAAFQEAAVPYWNYGDHLERLEIGDVSPGEPCAGIVTCLSDALKWVQFHLQEGLWEGMQLVEASGMKELHRPQICTELWPEGFRPLSAIGGYGLGWFVYHYRGHHIVFHLGEIEGYSTLFAFVPNHGISYVSYVNMHKPAVFPLFSVFHTVLDRLLELEPLDWSSFFKSKIGSFGGLYEHWNVDLTREYTPIEHTKTAHAPQEYAGKYQNEGYGVFEIECEDGKLAGIFRGVKQKMEHIHFETYRVVNMKADTFLITFPLQFETDCASGRVTSFTAKPDPGSEPVRFRKMNLE